MPPTAKKLFVKKAFQKSFILRAATPNAKSFLSKKLFKNHSYCARIPPIYFGRVVAAVMCALPI